MVNELQLERPMSKRDAAAYDSFCLLPEQKEELQLSRARAVMLVLAAELA